MSKLTLSHISRSHKNGFTLIELLIVVAIIAILAAIAVPNFLEAQTRAKIARARADLRTVATGLETYHIDHNKYPRQNRGCRAFAFAPDYTPTLERLTTPISYLSGEGGFYDPFDPKFNWLGGDMETERDFPTGGTPYLQKIYNLYWYNVALGDGRAPRWDTPNFPDPNWWYMESCGPDAHHHTMQGYLRDLDKMASPLEKIGKLIYDATNGTISRGSIWRAGGAPIGEGTPFYNAIIAAQ